MLLKRLTKSKSLRIVNLLGLSVIFSCLLLSYAYVKRELMYDRFHENADRIVRFSVQYNDESIDGRNYGFSKDNSAFEDVPGIEDVVFLSKVNAGVLTYNGKPQVVNDFLFASSNFFEVFSFSFLEGERSSVLDGPEKAVISKKYALQLFGDDSPIGKEIQLSGRRFGFGGKTVFISGVFDDFPEISHFHTDLIINRPDNEQSDWAYIYMLLHTQSDVSTMTNVLDSRLAELNENNVYKVSSHILPLTDIHLHSRLLRELEPNGNVYYIYLIIGANILLLSIVLFNLWLNTGLIFSFNRRYYQLLRLNGASPTLVIRDEGVIAFILGLISLFLGGMISYIVFSNFHLLSVLGKAEIVFLCLIFISIVLIISLLPVFTRMSSTLFLNLQDDLKPSSFTLDKVKYMLIAQYSIVIFIVIVSIGISKQINLIKVSQVGDNEETILVMNEQPDAVQDRYELLKNELQKYPEIKAVTTAMQLPGSAIRDVIRVRQENETEEDNKVLPVLVVGDDFLPFFDIKPIAGTVFQQNKRTYSEEQRMLYQYFQDQNASSLNEEYIINCKAAQALGFDLPEEAVGKTLFIRHQSLGYINKGTIIGVTDDFNYTNTYEEVMPQILLQRKVFQHCMMVYLSPDNTQQALNTFTMVWNDIYPDYPANYTFLKDVYDQIYYNDYNAEKLVQIFSLLCLIIANLGIIIIMAFVIKRKMKEIAIRKVNGATVTNIVNLLNSKFVIWIGIGFVIAIPIAYYVMMRWLERFVYKTSMDWWIFILAGISVLLLSVVCVSLQTWKAACSNPIKTLKME